MGTKQLEGLVRKGIGGFYTVDLHRPGQIPQGPHLPLRGG